MSRRKQAAIAAAKRNEKTDEQHRRHFAGLPMNRKTLGAAGIALLLALGVVGATVSGMNGGGKTVAAKGGDATAASWLPNPFAAASSAAPPAVTVAAPLPLPPGTPQLSKEYIYAGSRMLAVEDAAASGNQSNPTDLVVWRPGSGTWYVRDSSNGSNTDLQFGQAGDRPIPADFNGDGLYDFCVVRSNGDDSLTWYYQVNGSTGFQGTTFGATADQQTPADFDGDGRADIAVWRSTVTSLPNGDQLPAGYFIIFSSDNSFHVIGWGQAGDKPAPADYDGDGRVDAAVFRESNGTWYIRDSSTNAVRAVQFGQSGDVPAVGDYDGDGRFDLSVWRSGTWYVKQSSDSAVISKQFGQSSGDHLVAGDYDGDGRTDMAVWREASGTWYIQQSITNTLRADQWGQTGDKPVPAPMNR